jgi:hypothetical protein
MKEKFVTPKEYLLSLLNGVELPDEEKVEIALALLEYEQRVCAAWDVDQEPPTLGWLH